MKLQLVNSMGLVVDTIDDDDKTTAFERALNAWAADLNEGDTIRVIRVDDDE